MNDDSFPCDVLETTAAVDLCERVDVRLDPERFSNRRIRAVTHRVLLLEVAADPVAEPGYRDRPAARRILVGTIDALRGLYDPSDSAPDVQWHEGPPPAALAARVHATFAAADLEPRPILRWAEDTVAEIRARPRQTRRSTFIRTRPARFVGRWMEPAWKQRAFRLPFALHAPCFVLGLHAAFVPPSPEMSAASVALSLAFCVNLLLHGLGDVFGESRSPRGRRFAAAAARAPRMPASRPAALAAD
jgi:hypothetical protein